MVEGLRSLACACHLLTAAREASTTRKGTWKDTGTPGRKDATWHVSRDARELFRCSGESCPSPLPTECPCQKVVPRKVATCTKAQPLNHVMRHFATEGSATNHGNSRPLLVFTPKAHAGNPGSMCHVCDLPCNMCDPSTERGRSSTCQMDRDRGKEQGQADPYQEKESGGARDAGRPSRCRVGGHRCPKRERWLYVAWPAGRIGQAGAVGEWWCGTPGVTGNQI